MANLVRQEPQTQHMHPFGDRDPFRVMREMLRWEPFREMGGFSSLELHGFTPRFDVKENHNSLLIQGDLPGTTEKDIQISVTGNRLTISGERRAEEKAEDENYYMFERSYGSFNRTFTLPEDVEPERIQAELRDGVLRLTVPKKANAQPKRIQVRAGK